MEPRVPCPDVFINEVGHHYPPCPSYEILPSVPAGVITAGVMVWLIVMFVLLGACLLALTFALGRD